MKPSANEEWDQIFSQWKESGLSQKEFCAQQGIKLSRFYYLKQKQNAKNEGGSILQVAELVPVLNVNNRQVNDELSIHIGNSVTVPIHADTNEVLLAKLVTVLIECGRM